MDEVQPDPLELAAAHHVRSFFADLIAAPSPANLVLVPGITMSLCEVLFYLDVRHLVMTRHEYLSRKFPGMDRVETLTMEEMLPYCSRNPPQAILMSLVTFREGALLPVAEVFHQLREKLGERCPLLIVDYAHAGAAGWPPAPELGADIVCGDLGKWILPSGHDNDGAFLWFPSGFLFANVIPVFWVYYLALHHERHERPVHGIHPLTVRAISTWLERSGLNRSSLQERHGANMKIAYFLAKKFFLPIPQTSLLLIDHCYRQHPLLVELANRGLVWPQPDGNLRVRCQSYVMSLAEVEAFA